MNYVSHALVAAEVRPKAPQAFIFGSMAPDLVGMAGTKLVRHCANSELAAGIEFHIATDSVFDHNSIFTSLKAEFRPMHEEYLSSGAARACADAGTEMLLDGFTVQRSQVPELYESTMDAASALAFPVGQVAVDGARLVDLVEKCAEIGTPYFYQDPTVVAQRLQHRLAGRPRLAFDQSLVPQVAKTFEAQRAAISKVANQLIEETVSRLRAAS